MKKKILLIPLALLLAISLVAIGCPAPVEVPAEIAELEKEVAAEKAKVAAEKAKVAELEAEIAELKPPAPPVPVEPITLTYAYNSVTWGPLTSFHHVLRPGGVFQRLLYERTDGQIQLNIIPRMFPGYPAEPAFIAIQKGEADLGDVSYPYMTGTYPLWAWEQIPGTVNPDDSYLAAEEQAAIYRDPAVREFIREMFREHGVEHLIAQIWSAPTGVFSNIEATTIAELQTLKTRVYGYYMTLGFKELGIPAVYLPAGEVPGAILAGTIDASFTNYPFGYQMGWHTVTDYVTLVPFSAMYAEATFMNAEVYDGLPDHLRRILRELCDEMTDMMAHGTAAENAIIINAIEEYGLEIIALEPDEHAKAVETLKVVEEEYIKDAGPKGAEILRLIREAVANYRAIPEHP